jgi:hypothetical protein
MLGLAGLSIDIAYYIQQIQIQTAATIKESENKLKEKGKLLDEDRINILLRGAMTTAKALEEEIYREVKQRENRSYDYCSNEMNMLALAAVLAAWSGWVFKSKSKDNNREKESREQAAAVNKYIESFIRNSINAGQRIGEHGGTPEGRREFIEIG